MLPTYIAPCLSMFAPKRSLAFSLAEQRAAPRRSFLRTMDEVSLRRAFALFDTDGSGTLDAQELEAILTRGGFWTTKEVQEFLEEFDADRSNSFNLDEFVHAWTSAAKRFRVHWSPLHHAAANGDVGPLLENQSDLVNALTEADGETPLHLAVTGGRLENAEKLIAAGTDINLQNKYGWTALHRACMSGRLGIVKLLLSVGADTSIQDSNGKTAASWALEREHAMVFALVDPERAQAEGALQRAAFRDANVVHVISTRYATPAHDASHPSQAGWVHSPKTCAQYVKEFVETGCVQDGKARISTPVHGTKCWDPNSDNAFLMDGHADNANAIWLQNWRNLGLARAKATVTGHANAHSSWGCGRVHSHSHAYTLRARP